MPSQPGKADDDVLGVVLLNLVEAAFVGDQADDVLDVIGLIGVLRHQTIERVVGPQRVVVALAEGRVFHVVRR